MIGERSTFRPEDGPGKTAPVMIWDNGEARRMEMQWGFAPLERGGKPVSLLRSERWEAINPCLVIANDFGLKVSDRTRYSASLITDQPFFCLAGVWRPATRDWSQSFAVLTVPAYPDLALYKNRHVAVVRSEDWLPWLTGSKPKDEILRPFPAGSFRVQAPSRRRKEEAVIGDLFA